MLVDISRRPVRLIWEECPTVIVVRTMGVRGKVDGLLHHERDPEADRRSALRGLRPSHTVQPKVTVPNGGITFIETILNPTEGRETYAVTGFQDQITKERGVWRINFILDRIGDSQLMTLLDETHSAMLFTVQVPAEAVSQEALFGITTPLRRYLNKQQGGGEAGLWGAVMGDDDF